MSQTECMWREIKFAGKVSKEVIDEDVFKAQFLQIEF